MTDETVTDIAELDLPFHRRASLKDVAFDGGLNMLRLTFREGRRFTIIDMDAASADQLGALMVKWAAQSTANPDN
jgi:Family of unknown function (DUF6967)